MNSMVLHHHGHRSGNNVRFTLINYTLLGANKLLARLTRMFDRGNKLKLDLS